MATAAKLQTAAVAMLNADLLLPMRKMRWKGKNGPPKNAPKPFPGLWAGLPQLAVDLTPKDGPRAYQFSGDSWHDITDSRLGRAAIRAAARAA